MHRALFVVPFSLLLPSLLLAGTTVAERHRQVAETIRLPDAEEQALWRSRNRYNAQVIDILMDRANWARALQEIENRIGLSRDTLDVTATLDEGVISTQAAQGGGRDGSGWIRFNMATLANYAERVEDFERQSRNPRAIVIVPPTYIDRMIWHELTHVFQNDIDCPDWFREGMACYVEQNTSHLSGYVYRGADLTDLNAEVALEDAYASGWMFWLWVEHDFRREGLQDLVRRTVMDGQPWREAIEAVTGLSWDEASRREFEYAQGYYERERRRINALRRRSGN